MILTDNIRFLDRFFPEVKRVLEAQSSRIPQLNIARIDPPQSKYPTLTVEKEGKSLFIHSKYNPYEEAERLLDGYSIDSTRHVFFYGMGLGYHLEVFTRRFPDVKYTVFEPFPEIAIQCLADKKLSEISGKNLQGFYTEDTRENTVNFLMRFVNSVNEQVLFIPLPSYQRIFDEQYREFVQLFEEIVFMKRSHISANLRYQKKWMSNAFLNFEYLLKTPSVFDCGHLRDKPAIIVAAGPSVMDEIENLRRIKDNGLAYIFAAGSGLHPLLNHHILPDGAFSYDPNDNTLVFQPVFEQHIDGIPLCFGSSVGFSRLNDYPGPKCHFILSVDTLSPYYLKYADGKSVEVIMDAPTISTVILQILCKLGCNPIILVGQNLAYRGELRYAGGISYYDPKVTEEWLKGAYLVDDVSGGKVYTNDAYRLMRESLEYYIRLYPDKEFINTTQGGARIEGAPFMPLEEVIHKYLADRVVSDSWLPGDNSQSYDLYYLRRQQESMEREYQTFKIIQQDLSGALTQMETLIQKRYYSKLETTLNQFNKHLKALTDNQFFRVFLESMVLLHVEQINRQMSEIIAETDLISKAKRIDEVFAPFIQALSQEFSWIEPQYRQLADFIVMNNK
ncbi:MAG TPA: DUF115 domain-containing protein [Bacillota bacterium]|nr:DUF115 domain-containing protein [Bacillota bacterium]